MQNTPTLYHELALQHTSLQDYLQDISFLKQHHEAFKDSDISDDMVSVIFNTAGVERKAFILKDVYMAYISGEEPTLDVLERAVWGFNSQDVMKLPVSAIVYAEDHDKAAEARMYYIEQDTHLDPIPLILQGGVLKYDVKNDKIRISKLINSYENKNFPGFTKLYGTVEIPRQETLQRFESLFGTMSDIKKEAFGYYDSVIRNKLEKFPYSLFSKAKTTSDLNMNLPTTLYHGTQRRFLDFSVIASNSSRNSYLGAGDAIYFTPSREVAQKYANAPMATLLPSMVVGELRLKSPILGDLLGAIIVRGYENGWAYWQNNLKENERDIHNYLSEKGIDINDVGDLRSYFSSVFMPEPIQDEISLSDVMFFLSDMKAQGTPDYVYDLLQQYGVGCVSNTPLIEDVFLSPHARIRDLGVIEQESIDSYREQSIQQGYDGIRFLHEHAIDDEPEIALWNTACVIRKDDLELYCREIYQPRFMASLHADLFTSLEIGGSPVSIIHDTAEAESFLEGTMTGTLLPDLVAIDPIEYENDQSRASPRVQNLIESLTENDSHFRPVVLAIPLTNEPYIGEGQHRMAAAQYLHDANLLNKIPAYVVCETPDFLRSLSKSHTKENYMSCNYLVNDVLANTVWLEVQKGETNFRNITYTFLPKGAVQPEGYSVILDSIQDNPTIITTFSSKNNPLLSMAGTDTQAYAVHYVPKNPLIFRNQDGKFTSEGLATLQGAVPANGNVMGVLINKMNDPLYCDFLREQGYDAVIDQHPKLGAIHLLYPEKATFISGDIDLEKLFDFYKNNPGIPAGLMSLRENFLSRNKTLDMSGLPNKHESKEPAFSSYADFAKQQQQLLKEPFVYLVEQPSRDELFGSHRILIHNFSKDNFEQEKYYKDYIVPALLTPEQKKLLGTYSDFCDCAQQAAILLRDYNGTISLEGFGLESDVLKNIEKGIFMGSTIVLNPSLKENVFNEPYVAFLSALKSSDCSLIQLIESEKNAITNTRKVYPLEMPALTAFCEDYKTELNLGKWVRDNQVDLISCYSSLLLHDIPITDCYRINQADATREVNNAVKINNEHPVYYLIGAIKDELLVTPKEPLMYSRNLSDVLCALPDKTVPTPMHILEPSCNKPLHERRTIADSFEP